MTKLNQQQVKYLVDWARRDLNELLDQGYDDRDLMKEAIIYRIFNHSRGLSKPSVPRRLISEADADYIAEYILAHDYDRMAEGADDLYDFANNGFRNYKASALTTVGMLVALGTLLYLVKK